MNLQDKLKAGFTSGKLAFKTQNFIISYLHAGKQGKAELKKLVDGGSILKHPDGTYSTPEQAGAFKSSVRANARGFAFVCDGDGNEYFVPHKALSGAINKDVVLAAKRRGTDDEAYVLKILKRGYHTLVGTYYPCGNAGIVMPDDELFEGNVIIPRALSMNANRGDKVVCELTSFPKGKDAGGKIIEILGQSGDFFTEETAIIRSYSLKESFSSEAEKEAEICAARKVVADGRRDLRGLFTVTIDGEDTRDMDDAVTLERADGGFILGVHIADVSSYVSAKSALDKEAYERGTSVYFPDRVYPMLPKALSNGACSLSEGEDRYALSCMMHFDGEGNKLKSEIFESVIKSDRQLTYSQVSDVLANGTDDESLQKLLPLFNDMRDLCLLLEGARDRRGGVDLDVKESHIYLGDDGGIVIPETERTIAHRIIEQFMIAANESVAEFGESNKLPFLYRVHESPAPEKAQSLFAFAKGFGLPAKADSENVTPRDYKNILDAAKDLPCSSVLNRVMLRSMQKARYSEKNTSHFGLALRRYCHFTSPIRRYPDLFVHRVIKLALKNDFAGTQRLFGAVRDIAIDSSERERNAELCERNVDNLYKVQYMSSRIGEEFDAVISGVTEYNIYAELKNGVEGRIAIDALPPDSYELYEDRLLLKGKKRSFAIGDPLRVKVVDCDFVSLKIEFEPAD